MMYMKSGLELNWGSLVDQTRGFHANSPPNVTIHLINVYILKLYVFIIIVSFPGAIKLRDIHKDGETSLYLDKDL